MKKTYAFRYLTETWNKEVPKEEYAASEQVFSGVRKSGGDYGYTDALFIASILKDDSGDIESILLLDTETGPPTREMLLAIRDQIDHQLEAHT